MYKIVQEKVFPFIKDLSTDKNSDIYLSTKMDNGGSLEESKAENLEIGTIININKPTFLKDF